MAALTETKQPTFKQGGRHRFHVRVPQGGDPVVAAPLHHPTQSPRHLPCCCSAFSQYASPSVWQKPAHHPRIGGPRKRKEEMEGRQLPFKCDLENAHISLLTTPWLPLWYSFCPWLQGRLGNVVCRCRCMSPAITRRKGGWISGHDDNPFHCGRYLHSCHHCPVSGSLDT